MTDTRRLGHAQRRRLGAPSNVYADTMNQPSHGIGDTVKAAGRYRTVEVTNIMPNIARPGRDSDGHGYVVRGGKGGRETVHLSGELQPFEIGQGELQ